MKRIISVIGRIIIFLLHLAIVITVAICMAAAYVVALVIKFFTSGYAIFSLYGIILLLEIIVIIGAIALAIYIL